MAAKIRFIFVEFYLILNYAYLMTLNSITWRRNGSVFDGNSDVFWLKQFKFWKNNVGAAWHRFDRIEYNLKLNYVKAELTIDNTPQEPPSRRNQIIELHFSAGNLVFYFSGGLEFSPLAGFHLAMRCVNVTKCEQ